MYGESKKDVMDKDRGNAMQQKREKRREAFWWSVASPRLPRK